MYKWIALFFIYFWTCSLPAQAGFKLVSGSKQVDIPFEYINNFIVLTLIFNDAVPLKFIFDTGAEHTVLSKREVSDMLHVRYEREFRISGSDLSRELVAYLVRQVKFEIPGKGQAPHEDILVLQEDYFRFEEYAGVSIHGILSANIFSNYYIKINYQRHIITLIDRALALKTNDYSTYPMEVMRNKIYLNTNLRVIRDSITPVKLLLDTGAGLPLLLFTNTNRLLLPPVNAIPSNIGMGLGGYLQGYAGRIYQLNLEPFALRDVVSFFQDVDTSGQNQVQLNRRNGLIGNSLLNRYTVILDYQGGKLYLKPNKRYNAAFVYDRSGISLVASGLMLNTFTVQNVLPYSPAWNVDIRRGDELIKIGHIACAALTLDEIVKIFQKKPGKQIKLVIRRDGKRMKKTIVLKDLL
ncbi:MAG: PDZ domain-containing protein [Bacteroidetes bacterium]|nr:PDZ domain-containing protein [Bacteroidota bacterium]